MAFLSYREAVAMSTEDLRKEIRTRGIGKGLAVALAPKVQCIKWVTGHEAFNAAWRPGSKPVANVVSRPPVQQTVPASTTVTTSVTPKVEPKVETKVVVDTKVDNLGKMIAEIVQQHIKVTNLDMTEVERVIKAEVAKIALPTTIEVKSNDVVVATTTGLRHHKFEHILKLAAARENVWIAGPAGGGKTTLAKQVAEALNLRFFAKSYGLHTPKSEMFGQRFADGTYIGTDFREAYENGGVYLGDEWDACNPNLQVQANAAIENGFCSFPDKTVERHPDFVMMVGCNTFGRGADSQYVGRQQQDAAAIDRWVFVELNYDEKLELALSGNPDWVARVQKIRKVVYDLKEKVIVSPRASIRGARLLAAGFLQSDVEDMVVWKGINREVKQRILAHV